MNKERFKILVVDDHPIVRRGFCQLINHTKEFRVCGEASNPAQTLVAAAAHSPQLVLLDLCLEGDLALETIEKLRQAHPQLKILVVSMQNEAFYAHKALEAGADGYILKEETPEKILSAIRRIASGKIYISSSLLKKMLYFYGGDAKVEGPQGAICKLSQREMQIFLHLGAGHNTRRIARDLSLGVKTVETYCSRVKKKLHAENLNELMREALRWTSNL